MVLARTFHSAKTRSIILFMFLLLRTTSSQCTICQNGQQVPFADRILAVPGFPLLRCDAVDQTLALLLPNETSKECSIVQSLGSICGCPVEEGGCTLCPNGDDPVWPNKQLPVFLSELFLGYAPTCEILDAHLKSRTEDDSICSFSRSFISEYCGCRDPTSEGITSRTGCSLCPDGEPAGQPDRNVTIGGFSFGSCGQFREYLGLLLAEDSQECSLLSQAYGSFCGCKLPEDSCSLCRDGRPAPLTEQPLGMFKDDFGGLVPTCDVYESFVAGFERDSQECTLARLYGSACGCAPIEDHCVICPGESMPEDHLDEVVEELTFLYEGFTATCGDAESYLQFQISSNSNECSLAHLGNFLCGCSEGEYSYLGADTHSKKIGLEWAPRVAAILSMIGSLCIIGDILLSKKKRKAVYSQLVLGMSIFDLIGSIAWAFSTMMIPTDGLFASNISGAHGNNATCKLQGFMIQLNFTAIFYNISLSIYYVLVIVYNWRDRKLRKSRWWMHGAPLAIGIGLAFGGLPVYKNVMYACHIQNPPAEATWYPIFFFTFVPIFLAIICTTVMMIRVYLEVRKYTERAARWKLPSLSNITIKSGFFARQDAARKSNVSSANVPDTGSCGTGELRRLQREVFIQFAFYLCAFYFSWTFILAGTLVASPSLRQGRNSQLEHLYPFFVTCLVLGPLQGFFNSVIYFRPWLLNRWSKPRRQNRVCKPNGPFSDPGGDANVSGLKMAASWRLSSGAASRNDAVGDNDSALGNEDNGFSADPSNAIAFLDHHSLGTLDNTSESGAAANSEELSFGPEEMAAIEVADRVERFSGSDN